MRAGSHKHLLLTLCLSAEDEQELEMGFTSLSLGCASLFEPLSLGEVKGCTRASFAPLSLAANFRS